MNQRFSAILVIALLVSGGATYLVYRMVQQRSAVAVKQETVGVVCAARNLEIGTLLHDGDLTVCPWAGSLPSGMANKKDEVLSRGVVATIYQGEPIMESRLAPTGAGAGLAATIPPGMRAVAVRVNDIVGVAGFVLPGMRVDVLIAGMPPNSTGTNGPQVKTVLQNIEVLSAGQNYQKDAEGKPVTVTVVNLLVDPQQAETLSLASNETRVQLVLRNPLDTQTAKTTGTSVGAIFGGPPAPPSSPPRAKPVVPVSAPIPAAAPPPPIVRPLLNIEVFNGAQRSEAQFPQPVGEKK